MAPATILCIGMAGSGKTTFMQRLNSDLHARKTSPYVVNLDPAVLNLPFGSNIDIRDSINYNKVMEEYGLGPNGAIMTSLNLFSTKIDQVLNLVEKRAPQLEHVLVDTPGQIECFVWSASGQIITDSFASAFPTMIAYIVDTPRSSSPATFMSNMLYACSLLYKTKLPIIIVFNKTDVQDAQFAIDWMTDFEAFQRALKLDDEENGSGYMGSLMSSLSLMLEEFYNAMDFCAVSAMTGQGLDDFFGLVDKKVEEFQRDYAAERERLRKLKEERQREQKTQDMTRLLRDLGVSKDGAASAGPGAAGGAGGAQPGDVLSDIEDDEDDDDEILGASSERDLGKLQEAQRLQQEEESGATEGIQSRYARALQDSQGDQAALEQLLGKTGQRNS